MLHPQKVMVPPQPLPPLTATIEPAGSRPVSPTGGGGAAGLEKTSTAKVAPVCDWLAMEKCAVT